MSRRCTPLAGLLLLRWGDGEGVSAHDAATVSAITHQSRCAQ